MQRGRSAINPFPESLDLNQGTHPENTSMDHSPSWNNMPNPAESRLSNFMLGATDGNVSHINAADGTSKSFSSWDRGESSSSANNMRDGVYGADSKTMLGGRSEDWSFPPPNTNHTSNLGNPVAGRPLNMQDLSSNGAPMSLNLTGPLWNDDCHRAVQPNNNLYKSGHSAMEQSSAFRASSSTVGTFCDRLTTSSENHGFADPSFGSWGSSCKRKALEGTSGQFYPGGSSSSNQPTDENIMQHPANDFYTTSRNLNISSSQANLSSTNLSEQVNPSVGVGMSRLAPTPFPSSSSPGVAESLARNFAVRSNHGRHESVQFDIPRSTSLRSSGVYTSHLSRPITNTDSLELRSSTALPITNTDSLELRSSTALPTNQNNPLNQPHLMLLNEARGTHSSPWNGSLSSRGGSSSSSFIAGQRGSGAREEVNARSSRRSNLEYPMTVSAPETRNFFPDQIDWSYAPGTSASSRNHPSGSRVGPSAGGRYYSGVWLPHQNQTSQNHHMLSESFPWIPSNRVEPESGARRSHFPHLPSGSSSLDEGASSSRHRLDARTAALLMDMEGDDADGWHSLAAVEGRHRLIRHVLNAMRRGAHLQAEDYMLIDPFINGFAEMQDRHRDMRLDVDNMSYEELLALEEQIGNVSTGLSEEQIWSSLKQHKHESTRGPNMEPCCICQEAYASGEDVGVLDCGHEFHTSCIKQWLTLKNLCPICKTTALKANHVSLG